MAAFDLPDFVTPVGRRESSVATGHALYLFNNPFVVEQADRMADSLLGGECGDHEGRARMAYRRALNREPESGELFRALELVRATEAELRSEQKAWASLCQGLLAANEFRYVD